MNLTIILAEADILVPNDVPIVDKVIFLNYLNQDFFNVVKIPITTTFPATKDVQSYTLPPDVRQKNIMFIMVGVIKYHLLDENTPHPMQNVFSYDDINRSLTLSPAPYSEGLTGTVRYNMIATDYLSSSDLSARPTMPEEYHWTLVSGLASYLANTQDDAIKASNYENQYKAAWNVAAQNYAKAVTQ